MAVLRGAFSLEWIGKLRIGLSYNINTLGPYMRGYSRGDVVGHFFGDYCNWQRNPKYEDFIRYSQISDYARALMGSKKVNFFH